MMSCEGDLTETSGNESHNVEIDGYGLTGHVFTWRCEVDWEYSYCTEDCTSCTGLLEDATVDSVNHNSYSVESVSRFSYQGNVSKNTSSSQNNDIESVEVFRQDLYEGDSWFGVPTGNANPYAKIEVNGTGDSTTIESDSDL